MRELCSQRSLRNKMSSVLFRVAVFVRREYHSFRCTAVNRIGNSKFERRIITQLLPKACADSIDS